MEIHELTDTLTKTREGGGVYGVKLMHLVSLESHEGQGGTVRFDVSTVHSTV